MITRRSILVALVCLWMGVAGGQTRDACRSDFDNLSAAIMGLMRTGEDEHEAMLREIQRMKVRHADGPAACRSDILVEEVTLTNFLSDYPGAIRLSNAYLATDLAQAFPAHRAFVLRVRGFARESLGETVAGAQDYFEAASLTRQLPIEHALQTLLDAAETAIAMGDLNTAERYHSEGERLLRDSTDGRPALQLRLGRLQSAQAGLLTLRLRNEVDPNQRQRLARTLQSIADSAAAVLSREMAFSYDVRLDLTNRALAHSAQALAVAVLGDPTLAQAALREATRLLAASEGVSRDAGHTVWMRAAEVHAMAGDLDAAQQATEHARDEGRLAGILALEAEALERMAQFADERGTLNQAEALYRHALALREVERERLELQDWSVSAFAASQTPYRGLARLLARQGRTSEAFAVLDQSRARHLREMRAQHRLRDQLSPEERLHVDSLLTAIEAARMEFLRDSGSAAQSRAAVRISHLQARLHAVTDLDAPGATDFSLPALQRVLRTQERSLVSYLIGPKHSLAFVVTADSIVARELPVTRGDIERLIRSARGPWSEAPDPAVALAPLHRLHEVLLRPLDGLLPPTGGLVIIPDGPLADIPFAMLLEAPATRYEDARYLVRQRAVSTDLAAALVLDESQGDRPTDSPAQGVLDLAAFGRSQFSGMHTAVQRQSGMPFTDLPFVTREIARVASHARARTVALNADATEPALQRAFRTGRVVHIASHAETDPAFPMHSRIHLWPSPNDDGILHLYEIQTQHIPAELVVLSGCSTADGQAQRGEGTLGLHYGLRAAGARATLASLWPVDDRAMADIMEQFYAGLASGLPKDQALQQAQVAYLDAHGRLEASPFYWASLVLTGDVSPVVLEAPRPLVRRLGLGAALIALSGLAWMASRRRHARRPDRTL